MAGLQRQSTESGGKTLGLHHNLRKYHLFKFKILNKLLSSAGDLDLDDQLQQFETRPGQSASRDGSCVQGPRCSPGDDDDDGDDDGDDDDDDGDGDGDDDDDGGDGDDDDDGGPMAAACKWR